MKKGILVAVVLLLVLFFVPISCTRLDAGYDGILIKDNHIAAAGSITVKTELIDGSIQEFILDKPDKGLFIPKMCWHTMQYSHNAVQIVIASSLYDEKDYIRSYDNFKAEQI